MPNCKSNLIKGNIFLNQRLVSVVLCSYKTESELRRYEKEKYMVDHRGYYCDCPFDGMVVCGDDIGRSN